MSQFDLKLISQVIKIHGRFGGFKDGIQRSDGLIVFFCQIGNNQDSAFGFRLFKVGFV